MRWTLLVIFLIIALVLPEANSAGDEFVEYVVNTGKVDPNLCWTNSPEFLYRRALSDKGWDKHLIFQSLAGMDTFYIAYASQLRPLVDVKFEKARNYRADLTTAFRQMNWFDAKVRHGGGTGHGHWDKQIPAHVEWLLCKGFQSGFECDIQGYTHEDLTLVAEVIIRGKHIIQGPEDIKKNKTVLREMFSEVIASLRQAEKHMSPKEQRFFRNAIMKRLARYL